MLEDMDQPLQQQDNGDDQQHVLLYHLHLVIDGEDSMMELILPVVDMDQIFSQPKLELLKYQKKNMVGMPEVMEIMENT